MARPCTVCTGKRRAEVDAALGAGTPMLRIARNTGHPRATIERHAEKCVPRAVELATSVVGLADLISGAGLATEAASIYTETRKILTEAKGARDLRTALDAIGRALDGLSLLGKLTGRLKPETSVNVAVLLADPAWQQTQAAIVDALRPFPGAREAVLAALPSGDR